MQGLYVTIIIIIIIQIKKFNNNIAISTNLSIGRYLLLQHLFLVILAREITFDSKVFNDNQYVIIYI